MVRQKYLCVIQARMNSTRLPGKVLFKVNHLTLLEYLLKRAGQSRKIDKIIIATSRNGSNDNIEKMCRKVGVTCFRGSENDVLDRYYKCSLENPKFEYIVRLTGDNPLIDPLVIDEVISFSERHGECDYVSNNLIRSFPYGLDVEIFKRKVLVEAAREARSELEREHVTLYIRDNKKFKKGNVSSRIDFSHFRLTVDTQEDFEIIKFIIKNSKITDGYLKYISLLTKKPKVMFRNTSLLSEYK